MSSTAVTQASADDVKRLVDAWTNLTEFILLPEWDEHIGTEEVVNALISRSVLERELDRRSPVQSEWLAQVREADKRFRRAAPVVLERVPLALYRDEGDDPRDWWWRIDELVLGEPSQSLVSAPEAARLKGVHPHTVRRAIANGILPARRIPSGFLLRRRDVDHWEPQPVGRPSTRSAEGDGPLDAFNAASTSGDYERARAIAQVLKAQPHSGRRCLAVAIDALNHEEHEDAEAWARRAIAQGIPERSRAVADFVLGRSILGQGRANDAYEMLRVATPIPGREWELVVAVTDALIALNRPAKAATFARQALRTFPTQPEVLYVAARAEWHANQVWEALPHIVAYEVLRPDSREALLLHGSIMGFLGDQHNDRDSHRIALRLFAKARHRDDPESLRLYGLTCSRLSRWRAALKVASQLMRLDSAGGSQAAREITDAAIEAVADNDSPELSDLLDAAERLVGETEITRLHRAAMAALAGDISGVLSRLNISLGDLDSTNWRHHLLVAVGHVASGDVASAYPLLRAVKDDLPAPAGLIMYARIAIDSGHEREGRWALARIAESNDSVSQVAKVATELLRRAYLQRDSGPLLDEATRLSLPQLLASQPGEEVIAADSLWEGEHPLTSPVYLGSAATNLN